MKAIVVGGSGLIGSSLLNQLLNESAYEQVIAINRRSLNHFKNQKRYREIIFNFENWKELESSLKEHQIGKGDVAFCSLGSTIKKAGSQKAFYQVDHNHVLHFAHSVRKSGVEKFLTVSALGADADSKIFYNRVKGEVEQDLKTVGFSSLCLFQPSLLLGKRNETRLAESWAIRLSPFYSPLFKGPLRKYHPIAAEKVAHFMVKKSLQNTNGVEVFQNETML